LCWRNPRGRLAWLNYPGERFPATGGRFKNFGGAEAGMEGSKHSLEYRKLQETKGALENLSTHVNPDQQGNPDGTINPGQWRFAIDLSERVGLSESVSEHVSDGTSSPLLSLIHHLLTLIGYRIIELEDSKSGVITAPKEQQVRRGRQKPIVEPVAKGDSIVLEMIDAKKPHLEICKALDAARVKTPGGARWSGLSWEAAYMDSTHRGAVKSWISSRYSKLARLP